MPRFLEHGLFPQGHSYNFFAIETEVFLFRRNCSWLYTTNVEMSIKMEVVASTQEIRIFVSSVSSSIVIKGLLIIGYIQFVNHQLQSFHSRILDERNKDKINRFSPYSV
jgi:hypothetical protein